MLIKLIVVIILQFIHLSNNHIVYFNIICQLHLNKTREKMVIKTHMAPDLMGLTIKQ